MAWLFLCTWTPLPICGFAVCGSPNVFGLACGKPSCWPHEWSSHLPTVGNDVFAPFACGGSSDSHNLTTMWSCDGDFHRVAHVLFEQLLSLIPLLLKSRRWWLVLASCHLKLSLQHLPELLDGITDLGDNHIVFIAHCYFNSFSAAFLDVSPFDMVQFVVPFQADSCGSWCPVEWFVSLLSLLFWWG